MNLRFTNLTTDGYAGNIYAFVLDPGTPTDSPICPTYTMVIGPSPDQKDVPWQVVPGGQIHIFCAIDDGAGGYGAVTDIAVAGGADLHRIRLQGSAGAYHFQYIT